MDEKVASYSLQHRYHPPRQKLSFERRGNPTRTLVRRGMANFRICYPPGCRQIKNYARLPDLGYPGLSDGLKVEPNWARTARLLSTTLPTDQYVGQAVILGIPRTGSQITRGAKLDANCQIVFHRIAATFRIMPDWLIGNILGCLTDSRLSPCAPAPFSPLHPTPPFPPAAPAREQS